jgi:hypothetical protein
MRRLAVTLTIIALCAPTALSQPAPTGQLEASGHGRIVMEGQLVTFGLLSEPSRLVVTDFDGDARVFVAGKPVTLLGRPGKPRAPHRVFLSGAEGRFLVTGSSVRVRVRSRQLSLSLAGVAQTTFTGRGTYKLDDGDPQEWGTETVVQVGPSEVTPEGDN